MRKLLLALCFMPFFASAAIVVGFDQQALPGAPGDVDFTDAAMGVTPVAAIFFGNHATANNTKIDDARLNIGMAASTGGVTQAAVSLWADDNIADSNTTRFGTSSSCYAKAATTAADSIAEGTCAFIADGVRLSVSDIDTADLTNVVMFGGDIEARITTGVFPALASPNNDLTLAHGLSGTPELLVMITVSGTTDNTGLDNAIVAISFYDPANPQYIGRGWKSLDAAAAADVTSRGRDNDLLEMANATVITVQTLDATNIILNGGTTSTGARVYVLAMRGTSTPITVKAGWFQSGTSTGTIAHVTGMALQPTAVLIAGGTSASTVPFNSVSSAGANGITIGAAIENSGGVAQASAVLYDEDNQATMDNASETTTDQAIYALTITGADQNEGVISFDADGVNAAYAIAPDNLQQAYIAFGMADSAPDAYTLTDKTNQAPSATISSVTPVISGFSSATASSSGDAGCKHSINGAAYTSTPGTITTGQTFGVQVTSSAASGGTKQCTGDVGGVTDEFVATTDSTAPTYGTVPAQSGIDFDSVSVQSTASDTQVGVSVVHYCGVYADGSTPTAAQVKAGNGVGFVAGSAMTVTVASGTQATMTGADVLTAATAYDVKCIAEDNVPNQTAVQNINITTDAAPSSDAIEPVMVSAVFTAANGTTCAGYTPGTNVPGNALVKIGSGTCEVQSNKLDLGASTGFSYDLEDPDMVVDFSWAPDVGEAGRIEVMLRESSVTNYLVCDYIETTSNQVQLNKYVAGVKTTLSLGQKTLTEGVTYRLTGFALGDQLGCMVGGVVYATAIDSAFNTTTKMGIRNLAVTTQTVDTMKLLHVYDVSLADTSLVADDPKGLFFGESLASGSAYWVNPTNLPDETYVAFSLFDGGSWYYDPEIAFIGNDIWGFERWNATSNAIESGTLTYTTQGIVPAAPVWSGVPDQSWPIAVPVILDLTGYMTTRGVPPASCTVQAGALVAGVTISDAANCIVSGTPTAGATSPTSVTIRATNATGTADDTWTQAITGDSVPDFPSFGSVSDATPTAVTACPNTVTLTGVNIPGALTASGDVGCEYSKNAGAFTAVAGTFIANDTLAAHVTAGAATTTKNCTIVAGGVSQTCSVTATPIPDDVPDPFTFPAVINAALSSSQFSCALILGLGVPSAVTSSGGNCTVDGGAASTTCGNAVAQTQTGLDDDNNPVYTGSMVCALNTASASNNTTTTTEVAIGGRTSQFNVTTLGASPVYVPGCIIDSDYELVVGDTLTDDLSSCWTGQSQIIIQNLPTGFNSAGSIISGVATTEGRTITTVLAINASGTDIRYLNWDIAPYDSTSPPHHPRPRRR